MDAYQRKIEFKKLSEVAAKLERNARRYVEKCGEAEGDAISLSAHGDHEGAKTERKQAEIHKKNAVTNFYAAQAQWEKAKEVAKGVNVGWCESRAEICKAKGDELNPSEEIKAAKQYVKRYISKKLKSSETTKM